MICQVGEPAFCYLLQIIDVKQERSQDQPLWCLLLAWEEHNQIITTLWVQLLAKQVFCPSGCPATQKLMFNLVTRIKWLKPNITEGNQVGQILFPLDKAMLTIPNHFHTCAQKWSPRGDPRELWNFGLSSEEKTWIGFGWAQCKKLFITGWFFCCSCSFSCQILCHVKIFHMHQQNWKLDEFSCFP